MEPEMTFYQLIARKLEIDPGRYLRIFRADKRPTMPQLKASVQLVRELIEDFRLSFPNLGEVTTYLAQLKQDRIALVLFCLAYADFFYEISTGSNASKLDEDAIIRYRTAADNLLTYIRSQMQDILDDNKFHQWVIEKQAPPSSRDSKRLIRRADSSQSLAAVQHVRPSSSTPPAS